ncbi:HAD family hydrolase [Corynebacterium coyleae]|uniref:HAD family hydrolase n=1 Tax=Corynebacterium coyleae TaxID=53374 RepID=UPI0012B998BD|nr:HAD family phosphatase [Corynebacterium coyleae]MDK8242816.1 HAD family phosphatase [Corynebacterium coyleae]
MSFSQWVDRHDAVLFDYNGTLSNDEHILEHAYDQALTSLGLRGLTDGEYSSHLGKSDPDIASALLSAREDNRYSILIEELGLAYQRAVRTHPTISGDSIDFVHALINSGKKVTVVTGTFRELLRVGLDQAQLTSLSTHSVTIEDVDNGKPNPEGFLLATQRLGVKVANAIGFEDSPAGVAALKAAGIPAVGIGPHIAGHPDLAFHFESMDEAAHAYFHP